MFIFEDGLLTAIEENLDGMFFIYYGNIDADRLRCCLIMHLLLVLNQRSVLANQEQ